LRSGEEWLKRYPITALQLEAPLTGQLGRVAANPLLARIRQLDLGGARLVDADLEAFAARADLPLLTKLSLAANYFSAGGLAALCTGKFPNLRALDLSYAKLDDEATLALERGAPFGATLESLSLANNRIGPRAARALAGSSVLTALQHLDVSYNQLGEEGTDAFARGTGLPALRTLRIHGNALTTDAEETYLDWDGAPVGRGETRESAAARRAKFAHKVGLTVY
jgi:hypothetical protein